MDIYGPAGDNDDDDDDVLCVDRATQTSLQYDTSVRQPCPPATTSPDKCTQTVDVPPCTPSVLQRSIYSGWTGPPAVQCSDQTVQQEEVVTECDEQPSVEQVQSFDDSVAGVDHRLTQGVRQCRQHIDEISQEATSMERLLSQLASTSPQRERVLEAVHKLDSLRRHINSTQELLSNVDAMIHQCEQAQPPQQSGSTTSRTELLQRELGRLNSRLCCTVLALERAMSKAICRGAQSGVVTTRLVTDKDYCCASDLKPARLGDVVSTSQSAPDNQATSKRSSRICEEWLNSQKQQEPITVPDTGQADPSDPPCQAQPGQDTGSWQVQPCVDDDGPVATASIQLGAAVASNKEVSLEDIHRMLGDIISDIDQPANNNVDDPSNRSLVKDSRTSARSADMASNRSPVRDSRTSARAMEVASNESLMSDSVVASSTNLLPVDMEQTSNNNQVHHHDDFDDHDFVNIQAADDDCGLFHCPSFGDSTDGRQFT